jgi:SnoaL-like domain
VILIAMSASAAAAEDASDARVRTQIEARYESMAKAFAARDTAAVFALRTPDFCIHYPDGERDSADNARRVLAYHFSNNLPPIEVHYKVRSLVTPGPDLAVVDVFQKGSRYQVLNGKKRKVEYDVTQRETWRRIDGVWLLASIDDLRDRHRWVDGVAVDPSKPFDPTAKPFRALR